MTREEIIKALRCYASVENCPVNKCNKKCPYWLDADKFDLYGPNAEISDRYQLCRAAADMLEKDVKHNPDDINEICELRDRVENLTLYLKEVFDTDIQLYDFLGKRHPGLPGYAPNIYNN